MSGLSWEREVANYLEDRGYSTKLRETIMGHEMDVYAMKSDETLVVECKDWNSSVSPDAIRRCKKVSEDVDGKPAIAYTSELSSGAEDLAERWSFIRLSIDVVRGDTLSLEDVRQAVEEHELCLVDEGDLSKLEDPLGPFVPDESFTGEVAQAAHELPLQSPSRSERWLRERISDLRLEHRDADVCVPVLRFDELQVDLYFIDRDTHDALPEQIAKEELNLN
jgi:Holliday junction resolvase